MPSKRSFFNRTLFRKNLSRFWPLWGGVSLLGSLAPLFVLLQLLGNAYFGSLDTADFTEGLYQVVTVFVPAASFVYAALCAVLVWSYLFSPRSVGLMHTLPIDRTGLFVTNTLSGLAMMTIPYMIVGGLTCLIAAGWGFFSLWPVVQTAVAVICMTLLFFGLATICAMATGNLFAMPAFYLLVNFLSILLNELGSGLAQKFLVGLPGESSALMEWLSPLVRIYSTFSYRTIQVAEVAGEVIRTRRLAGMGTVLGYGLVGLILLALSWLLYRVRHSESAGDVVAFRWLRPVFRYGVAVLSTLTVGWLLYEILWGATFQKGWYADVAPMIVCLAAGGVVGYYAASMLLDKSLRVFRGSWRGVAVVCAVSAVLVLCLRLDVTGAESRVPELEDVQTVTLHASGDLSRIEVDAGKEPELARRLLELHRAVVSDLDYIRKDDGEYDGNKAWIYLSFTYTLADGSQLQRRYSSLPVTRARMDCGDTYDALAAEMIRDPQMLARDLAIDPGYALTEAEVYFYQGEAAGILLDEEEAKALYDALLSDTLAGRRPQYQFFSATTAAAAETTSVDMEDTELGSLYFYLRQTDGPNGEDDVPYSRYSSFSAALTSGMTDTMAALERLGVLTAAELERWEGEK